MDITKLKESINLSVEKSKVKMNSGNLQILMACPNNCIEMCSNGCPISCSGMCSDACTSSGCSTTCASHGSNIREHVTKY